MDPIQGLIGARVVGCDSLPDERHAASVEMDGRSYPWWRWADIVEPEPGTEVWARFADQFYAGKAAVTHRDRVTFVGPDGEPSFFMAVLAKVAKQARLSARELPERVLTARRDDYGFALNFDDVDHETPAPAGAKYVVGRDRLSPAGVAVWVR
jgi:beta-galactosidase